MEKRKPSCYPQIVQPVATYRLRCPSSLSLLHRPSYSLTPRSRVLLKKLTGSQLVKKFPAFYATRRLITSFTSARHLSLSWVRSIQSMPPHPHFLKIHLNIILPSTPGSSKWISSPQGFPQKPCIHLSSPPHVPHAPTPPSHSSRFDHPNNIGLGVQITLTFITFRNIMMMMIMMRVKMNRMHLAALVAEITNAINISVVTPEKKKKRQF